MIQFQFQEILVVPRPGRRQKNMNGKGAETPHVPPTIVKTPHDCGKTHMAMMEKINT